MLQKSFYPYEYMNDCEKFDETLLPRKENVYSQLNIKGITDADYTHAKRVCIDFERKNLGEYHDLSDQSGTFLLADVFNNFQNMSWNIWARSRSYFSAAVLAWKAVLKGPK